MSRRSSGNCVSQMGCGCGCGCDSGCGCGNAAGCFSCGDFSCVLSSIYNVYVLQYLASILYCYLGCGFPCGCLPSPCCGSGCNTCVAQAAS